MGVGEIQGLYGPVQVLETRIQQVWGLQELCEGDWRSDAAVPLRVLHPGYLNRGMGPDFRDARIEIGGQVLVGDVEVHLYREDWWRHGHDRDRRYEQVILHAVLFPGGRSGEVCVSSGRVVPEWIMGPWLTRDLESVAGGEAGLWGETAPELREWIEAHSPEEIRDFLHRGAHRRWETKVSMAAGLLEAHGWRGALHRMVLYALGFPLNRLAFWEMAETIPPDHWNESLLPLLKQRWAQSVQWRAGRPAARAEARLLAYARLPDNWMAALRQLLQQHAPLPWERRADGIDALTIPEEGTASWRSALGISGFQGTLRASVLGNVFAPEMVQRLMVDVFLPLAAAAEQLPSALAEAIWFHARPGHHPPGHALLLRQTALCEPPKNPLGNGLLQGLYRIDDDLRLERLRADRLLTSSKATASAPVRP